MTDTFDGGCACGAVRYRMRSRPMFVHCCHCKDCQRQTGTAFVLNALIEADRVELLSGDPEPMRNADRQRPAAHCVPLPGLRHGGVERIRRPDQAALRARRHAGRPDGAAARRAHLHALEAALDRAARRRAGVRGLLQFPRAWPADSLERRKAAIGLIRPPSPACRCRRAGLRGLALRPVAFPGGARRHGGSTTGRCHVEPEHRRQIVGLQHLAGGGPAFFVGNAWSMRPAGRSRPPRAAGTAAPAADPAARRRRRARPPRACT